ncbi:MAG: single-stranded DNA-binding protein [Halobacteriovoraceae bacterium]|jgi:single-strand DNA-binding protein|nr:single-stranded DNA-binding protein [Halobacteriovoraceae bacterium]
MSLNQCNLKGHLGKKPLIKRNEGLNSAFLSLATTENYTNSEGKKQETTNWVNIKVIGKTVDFVNDLSKGDLIFVSGKIKAESWTDKESGDKRFSQYLIAKRIDLIKKKDISTTIFSTDDIPF